MKCKNFFAVDLGATSGRTILGSINDGKLELKELTRFPNHIIEVCGHFYWDLYALYNEIIGGLKIVAKEGIEIESIGIDTWGCDFAFVGKDGGLLRNPYCYRDPHTEGAMEEYFKLIPKETVYEKTGIQFMNFNSLFQLATLKRNNDSALEAAESILFIPDALSYLLTGEKVCEYTVLSTSQMLNPRTKKIDRELIEAIGLKKEQFGRYIQPSEKIGTLTPEIQKMTGLGAIPVVAVAGHDTGAAVAAVPAKDEKFAYLSSGTWSLMGIETKDAIITKESYDFNFTNEGGIEGTTRFLKNICGMWLLESCRREWTLDGKDYSYPELIKAAMEVPAFQSVINPDAACFANPENMQQAIKDFCKRSGQHVPANYAELTRCIFDSLALRYRQVFEYLKNMAPFDLNVLHVIGGGSKNNVLNQFTSNAVGVPVIAGPSEGTAIGNIMLQAKAAGIVKDINEMRSVINNSLDLTRFEPQDAELWDEGYKTYLRVAEA
ncbi:MAG: rhamnulokinase [Bacteroidaceae bacterium]|nr:rhamnulokinase [Bacteroidaceae bacterium]